MPENDVYVYFRIGENETVMVVVNSNAEKFREVDLNRFREAWPTGSEGRDILSGEAAPQDSLLMEPMSIRIFSRRN